MKQTIIIVPLFLLLLVILYLFIPVFPGKTPHEAFISSEAQVVATQYDLRERVAEFAGAPLGKTVANLRYEIIGKELGFTDEEIVNFIEFKDELLKSYNDPLVQALVGREITVALLPVKRDDGLNVVDQLLDHLLFVSRPVHHARLMDLASWVVSDDDSVSSIRYGKHSITRFDLEDDRRISAARVEDLLILSFNEQLLRQGLDIYDGDQDNLLSNKAYMDKIEQFEGASFVGYLNFQGIADLVNRAILESSSSEGSALLNDSKVDEYESALFGAWREEDRIIDKAIITFNPELLDEHSQSLIFMDHGLPDSHTRIPADTIVYHWSNQFDSESLLGMLSRDRHEASSPEVTEFTTQLEKITGLTTVQLFALFEGEITLAVSTLNKQQLVPLPRFLLAVKSGDIEQLKSVVNSLVNHYSIPVRRSTYGTTEVISWGGIIGIGSILPALSLTENALIVSSNGEHISSYISGKWERSLADQETFIELSSDLLKPSNTITYLDLAQTAVVIQEMVSWGGTMLALKDRELARKSKVLIDELINPLLEGLSMYSIIGSRKYHDNNSVIFESYTLLEDGRK